MSRSLARLLAGLLLLACVLLAANVPATSAAGATLSDIEDEVMCTICGTTLAVSDAPSANRQRAYINELIAEGHSKEEIKEALVDEYGPEVLAVPDSQGFDLIGGWILPALAVAIAAVLVLLAAIRWRREKVGRDAPENPAAIDPEDDERLQRDLDRYA